MSLLVTQLNGKMIRLAQEVYDRHFERDPQLHMEYDDRRKNLMYENIIYNLGYLETALEFDDKKVFVNYAVWIYQLMCNAMKELSRDRVKEQMIMHYQILEESLVKVLEAPEAEKASRILSLAADATRREAEKFTVFSTFEAGKHTDIRRNYLTSLIKNDTRAAIEIIQQASKDGIELDEIYLDILQEVMYEVGDLWHRNEITVDKEHYCTSATQVALSHFYSAVFSRPRNGHKILTCCVGSELHEMGARMLSDLFEYHGWDSVYLGAAVPVDSIIGAIREHKPDLVGFSVTMPHFLSLCHEVVWKIRQEFPHLKIAVGGRAFQTTDEIWRKWDVDVSTQNAAQLIQWANENIVYRGVGRQ